MSAAAQTWFRSLRIGMSPVEKVVGQEVAYRASEEGGEAWPTLKTLAADTEIPRRTVCRALASLEARNVIRNTGSRHDNGAVVYRLTMGTEELKPLTESANMATGSANVARSPSANLASDKCQYGITPHANLARTPHANLAHRNYTIEETTQLEASQPSQRARAEPEITIRCEPAATPERQTESPQPAFALTAAPPPPKAPAPAAKVPAKRAAPKLGIPDDWRPDAKGLTFAAERGVDPRAEVPRFVAYHQGRDNRLVWDAAWRTWCMNQQRFAAERAAPRPGPDPRSRAAHIVQALGIDVDAVLGGRYRGPSQSSYPPRDDIPTGPVYEGELVP